MPEAASWASSLAAVTGAAAIPYGFTIVVSGSVLLLVRHAGSPTSGEVLAFALASVAGFAMLGGIASRRSSSSTVGPENHLIVTGIANVVAVACCLGEATLIAQLPKWMAWPLAAFVVVSSYLAIVALQHAVSHRHMAAGR